MRSPPRADEWMPASPLRPLIEEAVQRVGASELSRQYAERFGVTWRAANRLLWRVMGGQVSVTIDTADRLALLVGSNLSLLYDEQGWPRSA